MFYLEIWRMYMATPKAPAEPAKNPMTAQTAIGSGNPEADAEAAAKKKQLLNETASKSILTSGSGILEDPSLKKNILG